MNKESKFISKHIVKCPHCQKDILDHMRECPFCKGTLTPQGYTPMNVRTKKKLKIILTFSLTAIAIAIIVMIIAQRIL